MKNGVNRLYQDLAWLWPIWEDVEEYREECELYAKLIKKYANTEVQSLLDIGCGGGKNTFHLKKHFSITGIDINTPMLFNARNLNPECSFYPGDMRDFDLKREFDSVLMNDSITYIRTKEDLLKTFQAAYKHIKAGGVMIARPDICKEKFIQNKTEVSIARSSSKPNNIDVTFVQNNYDPNPTDNAFDLTLIYMIREDSKLRIEHDFHICGVFSLDYWRESLGDAGFEVNEERPLEDANNLPVFACVKPL